jgi:hypothetical protein
MSKKQNTPDNKSGGKYTNPYELKSDAVDRLAKAHNAEFKSTMRDPGREYRSSFLDKIPFWVKAVFMKFWFNGAVCYFIYWGLGLFVANLENMILILALSLGIVTDILVNNAFRFFAPTPGANDKWMMLPKKKLLNLFLNVAYSFVVLIAVVWLYNSINAVINVMRGTAGEVFLGVEPVLFGLFYVVIDLAFIGMKNLMVSIVNDAKKKNGV